MINDPRAILHLMLVEYRWLVLLYFTFFQLLANTTMGITNGSESDDYTDLILCAGLGKFNIMQSEAMQGFLLSGDDEYTIEVDSCDPKGPCRMKDCSTFSYSASYAPQVCKCSATFRDRVLGPFYLNMIMLVGMLGPYVLLVVYCIAFKSGGFNGSVAGQKYIESCQSVQNSAVFRTYCNVLGLLCAGGVAYGLYEAQVGADAEDSEEAREPDQQATRNLLVSGFAIMGLIRSPPRYGSAAGDYDVKMLRLHRNGLLTHLRRLLLWDSTQYYEEYMRADKYHRNLNQNTDHRKEAYPLKEVGAGDDAKPAGDDELGAGDDANTAMFEKRTGYGECFGCCN